MIKKYNISWDVPKNISFFISLNEKGFSRDEFKYANFSYSVGDRNLAVSKNIDILRVSNKLRNISFMNQTHSNKIKKIKYFKNYINSDAIYTSKPDIACAVLTADCIPILVTNLSGSLIGCIHVGWRGLSMDIIQKFFSSIQEDNSNFKVLIGPCISQRRYEVDDVVFRKLSKHKKFFFKKKEGKYNMDIRLIAHDILLQLGITDVTISPKCTYDDNRFYSYRRNKITGRFVSLIWFKK
tara:strand:- start:710 stop:1426 length:717 start_codon:yes stop_codon:yes gene_type:complete